MRPVRVSVSGNFPVTFGCLTGWVNAWTDSDVQGRPVDELLDVAVEGPALDQLEVQVGRGGLPGPVSGRSRLTSPTEGPSSGR